MKVAGLVLLANLGAVLCALYPPFYPPSEESLFGPSAFVTKERTKTLANVTASTVSDGYQWADVGPNTAVNKNGDDYSAAYMGWVTNVVKYGQPAEHAAAGCTPRFRQVVSTADKGPMAEPREVKVDSQCYTANTTNGHFHSCITDIEEASFRMSKWIDDVGDAMTERGHIWLLQQQVGFPVGLDCFSPDVKADQFRVGLVTFVVTAEEDCMDRDVPSNETRCEVGLLDMVTAPSSDLFPWWGIESKYAFPNQGGFYYATGLETARVFDINCSFAYHVPEEERWINLTGINAQGHFAFDYTPVPLRPNGGEGDFSAHLQIDEAVGTNATLLFQVFAKPLAGGPDCVVQPSDAVDPSPEPKKKDKNKNLTWIILGSLSGAAIAAVAGIILVQKHRAKTRDGLLDRPQSADYGAMEG